MYVDNQQMGGGGAISYVFKMLVFHSFVENKKYSLMSISLILFKSFVFLLNAINSQTRILYACNDK